MRIRLLALVLVASFATGCTGIGHHVPRECERAASWGADDLGWRVVAEGAEGERDLVATGPGAFGVAENLSLAENETRLRGAYGPPLETGRLELSFAAPPRGELRVALGFCAGAALPYTCMAPSDEPGVAGEGDGFGFTIAPGEDACQFTIQLNPDRFGPRDVLRWEATLAGGDTMGFSASRSWTM